MASAFVIREARPGDVSALVELEAASFTADRLSRRSWQRLVAAPSAVVLVACSGASVGGGAVVLFRRGSRKARLYSIARRVGAAYRGLGAHLLAAVERCAIARGCRTVTLEVQDDNKKALHLYERSGYRAVARLPGYYEMGRDGTRMAKTLDLSTR